MKIVRRGVLGFAVGTGFVAVAAASLVAGWLGALMIAGLLVR